MSEEQGYFDEMVRTRSTDLARPPWVQSSPLDGDQAGGAQTDRRAPAGRDGVRRQGALPGRAPDAGNQRQRHAGVARRDRGRHPDLRRQLAGRVRADRERVARELAAARARPRDVRALCEQGQVGGQTPRSRCPERRPELSTSVGNPAQLSGCVAGSSPAGGATRRRLVCSHGIAWRAASVVGRYVARSGAFSPGSEALWMMFRSYRRRSARSSMPVAGVTRHSTSWTLAAGQASWLAPRSNRRTAT